MNSLSMGKYRPAIILILALTVFLASCKGTSDDPKSWVVRTFAGTAGTAGTVDTAAAVGETPAVVGLLSSPQGVAVDKSGNVYVADTTNHKIRKITPGGDVSTFAGTGAPGSADTDTANDVAGTLSSPQGVAVVGTGDNLLVYVADTANHTIRKITSAGVVTLFAGTAGTASATPTTFNSPQGVAVNSDGTIVYVADTANNRIQKITIAAGAGTAAPFAGTGTAGSADHGTALSATFSAPAGVAVDKDNNVYVADTDSHTIRKIVVNATTGAGEAVSTLAGTGTEGHADTDAAADPVVAAEFDSPAGVAVDSSGNVYVADTANHTIRKITSKGDVVTVTTFAGRAEVSGTMDGAAATARFNLPEGVAVVGNNIYVADTASHTIRKIELK